MRHASHGGYFADPGYKDVPGMDRLGYPIAEIDADGTATLFKPQGTGGCITTATVKEQLLYEIPTRPVPHARCVATSAPQKSSPSGPDQVRLQG
jgi:hypothetical protein